MGIYTEEEVHSDLFTSGLTDFPEGVTPESFWTQIGEGDYAGPRYPKSTRLIHPLHRYIHRALAHTIVARRDSTGVVSRTDMFYLYCILDHHPCQLAIRLCRFLASIRKGKRNQPILGAPYVTCLAKAMGLYDDSDAEDFTVHSPSTPIDLRVLINMGMVRQHGTVFELLDGHRRPWVAPGQREPAQEHTPPRHSPSPPPHHTPSPPPVQPPPTTPIITYTRQHRAESRRLDSLARSIEEIQRIQRLECAENKARFECLYHILTHPSSPPPPLPTIHPDLAAFISGASTSGTRDSDDQADPDP